MPLLGGLFLTVMEEGKDLLQRHVPFHKPLLHKTDRRKINSFRIGRKLVNFPTNSNVLDLITYVQKNQCNFDNAGIGFPSDWDQ